MGILKPVRDPISEKTCGPGQLRNHTDATQDDPQDRDGTTRWSRHEKGISQWHFGMAPACGWELHAKRGEREVWSRPKWNRQDPDEVYGLVGPFTVDPKLFPAELIKSKQAK
jgi:hypothetical protein